MQAFVEGRQERSKARQNAITRGTFDTARVLTMRDEPLGSSGRRAQHAGLGERMWALAAMHAVDNAEAKRAVAETAKNATAQTPPTQQPAAQRSLSRRRAECGGSCWRSRDQARAMVLRRRSA